MHATCRSCGAELSPIHHKFCPRCGSSERALSINVSETISVKEALSFASRREFYEKNPWVMLGVIGITAVSSLLGLLLSGWPGVVAGLILGAVSYFLGPHAVIKVREVNQTYVG